MGNAMSVALTYHAVPAQTTSYSYDVPETLLREQLRALKQAGLDSEITFDDGDVTQCGAAARILQEFGLKATFFITLGWTGNDPKYMGWSELDALRKAGHRIGLHSWSHLLLTSCSEDQLQEQLSKPRQVLKEKLGVDAQTMSMPGGRWNARVLAACKQAGYSRVYTSDSWRAPFEFEGMTVLGRMNVTNKLNGEQLVAAVRAAESPKNKIIGHSKTAVQRVLGDAAYHRLWSLVNGYSADQEPGRTGY